MSSAIQPYCFALYPTNSPFNCPVKYESYNLWRQFTFRTSLGNSRQSPGLGLKRLWKAGYLCYLRGVGHPHEGRSLENGDESYRKFVPGVGWFTISSVAANFAATHVINLFAGGVHLYYSSCSAHRTSIRLFMLVHSHCNIVSDINLSGQELTERSKTGVAAEDLRLVQTIKVYRPNRGFYGTICYLDMTRCLVKSSPKGFSPHDKVHSLGTPLELPVR